MKLIYAMGIGALLDCILGDPHTLPHPIRWIGRLIQYLDIWLHRKRKKERSKACQLLCGVLLVISVLLTTGMITGVFRYLAYKAGSLYGVLADGVLFYYCIAPRCLYQESMAVSRALPDLKKARERLSMIVGRDTDHLTEEEVLKAAVETVAENTSDGVTAPILYMALLGPIGCFLYKAVNTMDSMVGYHNEEYEYFGKAAAKTDDLLNYIPSRLTAYAMLLSAFVLSFSKKEKMDWRHGLLIYRRDRKNHKSPNSAQTESVCAGVLGIQLAGDASYFGKVVHKPLIGDPLRRIERTDVLRANHLMYGSALVMLLFIMILEMIG